MNAPRTPDSFDKAKVQGEHVIRLAKQLADGSRPGVLSTVDRDGLPHMRWMATLSMREFPQLFALTSPNSRKIEHIRFNPKVSWMFTNDASSMVVNLYGTAKVVSDKSAINRIWEVIENKSSAYFLSLDTAAEGVAVIETTIENIECVVPRYDLHYPPKPIAFQLQEADKLSGQ